VFARGADIVLRCLRQQASSGRLTWFKSAVLVKAVPQTAKPGVCATPLWTALPAHPYSWYSGAWAGSDGTVYGWGVTDVTSSTMYHVAYVSTTLTSPKGRKAASGWLSAHNSVRADVSLPPRSHRPWNLRGWQRERRLLLRVRVLVP
jgi:hypothetical protein